LLPDPLAQLLQSRIRGFRHKVGQEQQLIFIQFGLCAATVRQRGQIPALSFLAQEFVDKGFMDTEHSGDFTSCSKTAFDGVNDSFTKV
jgi:hypothetical protein